jgi:hypothetical protein
MKRYRALFRDTWWLWLIIFGGGLLAGSLIHFSFLSALPIGVFTFFYFGLMRYDNEGNQVEGFGEQ